MSDEFKTCKCGLTYKANGFLKHLRDLQCRQKYSNHEIEQLKLESYNRKLLRNRKYKNERKQLRNTDTEPENVDKPKPPWELDITCKRCQKIFKQNVFQKHLQNRKCIKFYTDDDLENLKLDSYYKHLSRNFENKLKNPEEMKRYNAKYYQDHKEKKKSQAKQYYDKNKNVINYRRSYRVKKAARWKLTMPKQKEDMNAFERNSINQNYLNYLTNLEKHGGDKTSLGILQQLSEEVDITFAKINQQIIDAKEKVQESDDPYFIKMSYDNIRLRNQWQEMEAKIKHVLEEISDKYSREVKCTMHKYWYSNFNCFTCKENYIKKSRRINK